VAQEIRKLSRGFSSLFTGLKLIKDNPRILKLAIIPFILDFMILAGVFVWGGGRVTGWVEQAMGLVFSDHGGFWWTITYWPVFAFVWLAFVACLFFLGYILANLIAAPFNSLLAEQTLEELSVIKPRKFQLGRWIKVSINMLWASLLKTGVFLICGLLFFLVSFIPVVGVAASFGMLMIMAFDSVDYSFEILEFKLSHRIRFFRENSFYFAGSGLALGLTLLIPGLNFLLFPAAVVGSADLMRQLLEQKS
jgi:CysZ protein